jgi:hypothetical protein
MGCNGVILGQQMIVDDLFEIVRAKPRRPAPATGRLILVCRGGRLFGADPKGRVYTGRLETERRSVVRLSILTGTYEIPIRRPAMRRLHAQHPNVHVSVTGAIDPSAQVQSTTICVGGRPIDVEITYLGPLPP